jgi:hypothetical protein
VKCLALIGLGWLGSSALLLVLAHLARDRTGRSDQLEFHELVDFGLTSDASQLRLPRN